MKIFIITHKNPKDYSAPLFKEELLKRNIKSEILYYTELSQKIKKEKFLKKDVFFILRCAGEYPDSKIISRYFKNKIILDEDFLLKFSFWKDKLNQAIIFQKNKIPIPNFQPLSKLIKKTNRLPYPCVLKKKISSRGRDVFLIKSQKELNLLLKKIKLSEYFYQDYIPAMKDIRILLLNNKIIGAVERRVKLRQTRRGRKFGVKVMKAISVSKTIANNSIKIAKIFKSQFCGMDVIIDKKGDPYFLEINFSPQFNAFEEKTNINVAKKVIDFILKDYLK